MRLISSAIKDGFNIDNSATGRPWAYKGRRFEPDEAFEVSTEREETMIRVIRTQLNLLRARDKINSTPLTAKEREEFLTKFEQQQAELKLILGELSTTFEGHTDE